MNPVAIGALFAFGALIFWGFGDFLIQRSARKIGDWELLFLISAFGAIFLLPFVYQSLFLYLSEALPLLVLMLAAIVMFFASLIDFEALKEGKIAVVEPVYALEIPVAMFLSMFLINEVLDPTQTLLVITLIMGLILVSMKSNFMKSRRLERGVLLAAISAILIGASDFLIGVGARITNPLVIIWFFSLAIAICTIIYLSLTGRLRKLVSDGKKMPMLIFATCILDTLAWLSFAFATIYVPITIAVAISENYIALAAILGLAVTKEKILTHQKIGLAIALVSAVILAAIA